MAFFLYMYCNDVHVHCIVSWARRSQRAEREKERIVTLDRFSWRRRNVGGTNQIGERSIMTFTFRIIAHLIRQTRTRTDLRVRSPLQWQANGTNNMQPFIAD